MFLKAVLQLAKGMFPVTKFHSDGPVIHVSGQLWSIFNQSYERMSTIKVSMEWVLIPTVTQSMYGQVIDGRWIAEGKNKVEKEQLICNSSLTVVPILVNKFVSNFQLTYYTHFCQIKDIWLTIWKRSLNLIEIISKSQQLYVNPFIICTPSNKAEVFRWAPICYSPGSAPSQILDKFFTKGLSVWAVFAIQHDVDDMRPFMIWLCARHFIRILVLMTYHTGYGGMILKSKNTSYHKICHARCTKSQNLNVSHLVLQLSLPNQLKPGVKSRTKM